MADNLLYNFSMNSIPRPFSSLANSPSPRHKVVCFVSVVVLILGLICLLDGHTKAITAFAICKALWWCGAIVSSLFWISSVCFLTYVTIKMTLRIGQRTIRSAHEHALNREAGPMIVKVRRILLHSYFTLLLLWLVLESCGMVLQLDRRRFPSLPERLPKSSERDISIVAIGGSTIQGFPYCYARPDRPFSFPQLVGNRLKQLFPSSNVTVNNLAKGGANLQEMFRELRQLDTRPDVLLIYSGHNEFLRFPIEREAPEGDERILDNWIPSSLLSEAMYWELERTAASQAPSEGKRRFFDRSVCCSSEKALVYRRFRRLLEDLLKFCQREECLPILIVPASNESGFEPVRSALSDGFPFPKQSKLQRIYNQLDVTSLTTAERIALLEEARNLAPKFAETWYRLGRLFERTGRIADARRSYRKARDLDAHPFRATSRIDQIYRELAQKYGCPLIDAQEILRPLSQNGILGDDLFHDNCHPVLPAQIAFANAVLRALQEKEFPHSTWPETNYECSTADVLREFEFDPQLWANVFNMTARLLNNLSKARHNPDSLLIKSTAYTEASKEILKGTYPMFNGMPAFRVLEHRRETLGVE